MTTKKLTFRQKILVAGTLFGMFFGAGNLIFPVHLGQMAGRNAVVAMIGFIITAASPSSASPPSASRIPTACRRSRARSARATAFSSPAFCT